ncbi:unnamed protein product, partial [Mesorhabditis belari]|uniref:Uncharacterized protein n=1 Tax=Mesorhabditis belari TaxID=2138241 RepID=A0AAF3ED70_9BILA
MQVQLVYRKNDEEPILLEMHGQLSSVDDLDGQDLGSLQWLSEKEAMLAIGAQIIRGKLIELENPLLLTKTSDLVGLQQTDNVQLEISHVITHKLLFNTKPCDIADTLMPRIEEKENGTLSQHSTQQSTQ